MKVWLWVILLGLVLFWLVGCGGDPGTNSYPVWEYAWVSKLKSSASRLDTVMLVTPELTANGRDLSDLCAKLGYEGDGSYFPVFRDLGRQGWEMVAVTHVKHEFPHDSVVGRVEVEVFYFKRQAVH